MCLSLFKCPDLGATLKPDMVNNDIIIIVSRAPCALRESSAGAQCLQFITVCEHTPLGVGGECACVERKLKLFQGCDIESVIRHSGLMTWHQ